MPFCTVACNMPNGLILRIFESFETDVPVLGGGMSKEKVSRPVGAPVKINGPARRFDDPSPPPLLAGGYALTPGVDAEFWGKWLDQNKASPLVAGVRPVIFAHDKMANLEAEAREKRDVKSGLEPIDPKNLPKGIETAKAA
jgi:hypothetical protein